jgi:hypothetical protein
MPLFPYLLTDLEYTTMRTKASFYLIKLMKNLDQVQLHPHLQLKNQVVRL